MKRLTLLAVAVAAIAGILLIGAPVVPRRNDARGALLEPAPLPESRTFDPRQSAALFIGVRKFTHDESTLDVPYAADDAVDLAYLFALDRRVALVSPARVVIALSGRPQKKDSKKRLAELERAGAQIEDAEGSDILVLMGQQAALAGKDGMLIVSISSHGFVRDGVPYILGSTSVFQFPETAVQVTTLFDIAAASEAPRSLFLIDACRERITSSPRGASPETAAPLISRMKRVAGQVVLYAAAAGGYAYDDDGNGVFTRALLDGLHCKATLARGAVTVATLHTFVERTVRKWIRQHRDTRIDAATQVSMEGDSKNMPLCACIGPPPAAPPSDIATAVAQRSKVTAFASDGTSLWSRDVGGSIDRVEVADLDGDGGHEVVIGAEHSLKVFDRTGLNIWSAGEKMTLHSFVIDHLLRHDPALQITAVWDNEHQSVIASYSATGQRAWRYAHHGRLQHVVIDRPTSRHNRKIVASGTDDDAGATFGIHKPLAAMIVLDNKGKLAWKGVVLPPMERVTQVAVANRDRYSREITLSTAAGDNIHLDFDGNVLSKSSPRITFNVLPRNTRR